MLRRILLALFIALLLFVGYEWVTFPDVTELRTNFPKTTAFMELRREQLRQAGKDDTLSYTPVSYGRISSNLRRAVLVAEDNAFYEHKGVDVEGMREAIERDWKRKRITHGGSTITQQLAKNLYLSPSRNPLRKIKEYFIARSLENHLTKKRILELYLNVVEMGERVYGAEAAARKYFGKSASALSPREAALLAGCLPNPRVMNPGAPNKRLRWRQQMILSRLRRWGGLVETEVLAETKKKEEAAPPPAASTAEPPPVDTQPTTTETTATTDTDVETPPSEPEPPDEPPPTQTAPPPTNTNT